MPCETMKCVDETCHCIHSKETTAGTVITIHDEDNKLIDWFKVSLLIIGVMIFVLYVGIYIGGRGAETKGFYEGIGAYRAKLLIKCKSGDSFPIEGQKGEFVCHLK